MNLKSLFVAGLLLMANGVVNAQSTDLATIRIQEQVGGMGTPSYSFIQITHPDFTVERIDLDHCRIAGGNCDANSKKIAATIKTCLDQGYHIDSMASGGGELGGIRVTLILMTRHTQ